MVKYVDVTPTWRGVLPLLLTGYEHGNAKGRAMAAQELDNMARCADLYNAAVKAGRLISELESEAIGLAGDAASQLPKPKDFDHG